MQTDSTSLVEVEILSVLMNHADKADQVMFRLKQVDFASKVNGLIFHAIRELYDNTKPFDSISVATCLKSKGLLDDAGGIAYILGLDDSQGSPSSIEHYVDLLKQGSTTNQFKAAILNANSKLDGPVEDVHQLIDSLADELFELQFSKRSKSFGLDEIIKLIESDMWIAHDQGGKIGIQTGYQALDDRIIGLQPGDYMIIGGRPSVGKSAFALGAFKYITIFQKIPALYVTLEMGKNILVNRMLSSIADVNPRKITKGTILDDDIELTRLGQAMSMADNPKSRVIDDAGITPIELKAMVRREIAQYGVKIVFVDYLQKLRGGKQFSGRVEELGYISSHLQEMAKEFEIPVVALSQLNRLMEREGRAPQPSDLRGSGDLEQDADFVLMLDRKRAKKDDPDKGHEKGRLVPETDAYLNKGRNTGEETFHYLFDGTRQLFKPAIVNGEGSYSLDQSHTDCEGIYA